MYLPMLANAVDIEDARDKFRHYYMEPKLDGVRCIVEKRGDIVTMSSRSSKTNLAELVPHIASALRQCNGDFILDGELGFSVEAFAPGVDLSHPLGDYSTLTNLWPIINFNATMRVLGSGREIAAYKHSEYSELLGAMKLFVFDVLDPRLADEQLPLHMRWEELLLWWVRHEETVCPDIHRIRSSVEFDEPTYVSYVESGGEGVMLKNPKGLYVSGKRPARNWLKVKKFDTIDVRIMGYEAGKGKYEGQIGALIFGDGTNVVGRCSGMDDAFRYDLTSRFDYYKGKWMEIRYFGLVGVDKGGLRHPQFVRMRPDLDTPS